MSGRDVVVIGAGVFRETVLDVRRSRRGVGVLCWRWKLFNQLGVQVLDLAATSLFKLPLSTEAGSG